MAPTWWCARPGGRRCRRSAVGPWRSSQCRGCWAAARVPCPALSALAAGARGPPCCLEFRRAVSEPRKFSVVSKLLIGIYRQAALDSRHYLWHERFAYGTGEQCCSYWCRWRRTPAGSHRLCACTGLTNKRIWGMSVILNYLQLT